MSNSGKNAWIDIDNPPQVQYLLPFKKVLNQIGFQTILTARDYGITFQLLDERNEKYYKVGEKFGRSKVKKVFSVFKRGIALFFILNKYSPAFLIASSRSSAIAAWFLKIPSFIICDYEYSDLKLYKFFGSYIVHPKIIDKSFFNNLGFPDDRLISFDGLKENFTFRDINLDKYPAIGFNPENSIKILYRPPAEEGHYYNKKSGELNLKMLKYLSGQENIQLIYSPRYNSQIEYIKNFKWSIEPYLIKKGLNFVSLLKSIDMVISSGGTILREAAFLGIPAYSIFLSRAGMVDKYLEEEKKITFIKSDSDFKKIIFNKRKYEIKIQLNDVLQNLIEKFIKAANAN